MALKQENRWEARPRTAAALRTAVYVVPFLASAVASSLTHGALLDNNVPWIIGALLTLPVAFVTLMLSGRIMRRLLPLALLLKLSLLFPDRVPQRLGVALRAASPKRLARRVASTDSSEVTVAENVLALVAALNAHDRRTRGHSERVRALTMLLADELDLEQGERDRLEWAALLHDLGKLDVPTEILNKKGRPSEDEWQILQRHPAGGPSHAGDLADWLGPWIHAMDQHHERFDGTGYPLGLEGADIAVSGRIVAVSDAFEVMTATRSYKTPMTTQAARAELVKCSGAHFDPVMVRAFMAISIGDIHKVLGPMSWLASMPLIGATSHGIGQNLGRVLLGGSVAPAVAASVGLAVLAPGQLGAHHDHTVDPSTEAAIALAFAPASEGSEPGSDLTSLEILSPEQMRRVGSAEPVNPGPASENGKKGSDPPVDERSDPPADEGSDPLVPPELPVDPQLPDGGVLGGSVIGGIEDLVEPITGLVEDLVEPLEEIVDDVTEPLDMTVEGLVGDTTAPVDEVVEAVVEEVAAPVEDVVEGVTEPVEELVDPDDETVLPVDIPPLWG